MATEAERETFTEWLSKQTTEVVYLPLPQERVTEPISLRVKSYQREPLEVLRAGKRSGRKQKSGSKSRRQWATLAVTFPEKPDGQAESDYVLHAEVALQSQPQRRTKPQESSPDRCRSCT